MKIRVIARIVAIAIIVPGIFSACNAVGETRGPESIQVAQATPMPQAAQSAQSAQSPPRTRVIQPVNPNADSNAPPASGDVVELQEMTRDGKVVALRKTFNGSYGASLSYYPDMMIYYVALFQQSKFWRVFKTQNDTRAEAVYADFVKSSVTLADAEIRRIKLEAEKAYADKQIAAQEDRANRLQADLDIANAQQSQAATHQQEQQDAIRELRNEQTAAQAQLRALQIRVQQLQKAADGDLPPPVPSGAAPK